MSLRLILLACMLPMTAAHALMPSKTNHAVASLVSEFKEITPGSQFLAGLHFKIEDGWHVYWQNPGDYGEAPVLKWLDSTSGNSAIDLGEIQWPPPGIIQVGKIVSFAYEDAVTFPFTVKVEPGFSDKKLKLEAHAKWLVCKDVCIPGSANLSLELPVSSVAVSDAEWQSILQKAQASIPGLAPASIQAKGKLNADDFTLKISHVPAHMGPIGVFPIQADLIENTSLMDQVKDEGSTVEYQFKRSDRLVDAVDHFPVLLVLKKADGQTQSFTVDIPLKEPTAFSAILTALWFAFLGGLILNLMPCVFPVLSIKAMSVLKMSGQSQSEVKKMGWAYTLGILVSFWILVGVLLGLRAGGQHLGWGFQLQSAKFVFVFACLLFAFGLNLLGFFEIGGSFTGIGSGLANRDGFIGSFFTGVLATLVATPCTAPFMGSAIGFAFSQSSGIVFLIFTFLAIGLAVPYLLICYLPGIGRRLPKPGVWMETLKQFMAFPIFGTVVWLAWVLGLQASHLGLVILISAFFGIGFAVWISKRWPSKTWLAWAVSALSILVPLYYLGHVVPTAVAMTNGPDDLKWEKFSPEAVAKFQASGQPVFVDFTAAWCVSCQVNELIVFHSDDVKKKLKEMNFALLKGDWTNEDPIITQTLNHFGKEGVPFYLIYPKGKDAPAVPLPEVINAGLVLNELEKLK